MCCGLAMRYRHGLAQLCGVSSRARETKSAVTTVGVMDATLVEKRRGRKARVHCLHLELKGVCWRETWNERKKRREGGKGEEGKPRRSCNGPIQGELKSKHLICIFVTFSHSKIEAACCTQRHNRPSTRAHHPSRRFPSLTSICRVNAQRGPWHVPLPSLLPIPSLGTWVKNAFK